MGGGEGRLTFSSRPSLNPSPGHSGQVRGLERSTVISTAVCASNLGCERNAVVHDGCDFPTRIVRVLLCLFRFKCSQMHKVKKISPVNKHTAVSRRVEGESLVRFGQAFPFRVRVSYPNSTRSRSARVPRRHFMPLRRPHRGLIPTDYFILAFSRD